MIIYNDDRDYPEYYENHYDDTDLDNPYECDDKYDEKKDREFEEE